MVGGIVEHAGANGRHDDFLDKPGLAVLEQGIRRISPLASSPQIDEVTGQ